VARGEGEVIGGGEGEVTEEKEGKGKVFGGGRGVKTEEKEEKTGVRRRVVGEGEYRYSLFLSILSIFSVCWTSQA
jgi:hypothetical protein